MKELSVVRIHPDVFKLNVQGLYRVCILGLVHGFGDNGLRVSNSKLAALFSVDVRSVERAISSLKKDGFIRDIGTGKNNRCLIFVTDKITGNNTDKSAGSEYRQINRYTPDKVTGRIPAQRGNNTDKTTDHKEEVREEEESKEFFNLWSSKKNLPSIRSITPQRKQKLSAMMGEQLFADNWREIINKLSASSFATGSNDRQWKADIDWILKNSTNYVKVIEGKYDDSPQGDTDSPKPFTPRQEQAFLDKNTYLPTENEAEELMRKVGL